MWAAAVAEMPAARLRNLPPLPPRNSNAILSMCLPSAVHLYYITPTGAAAARGSLSLHAS
jgi:hypothetical protein